MNELQRQVFQARQIRLEMAVMHDKAAIVLTTQSSEPVADNRYRMLVTLIRTARPRYWNFRCVNCGSKIGEIQNLEVTSIDDFYDPQNVNNTAIGIHCKGLERQCLYSYFFHVQ